jgi:ABC-type cobalamin/Fe3+-siderophores transport system ATPase subunit
MEDNIKHIDTYLSLANSLRFKLWAVVGKDEAKIQNIISYLSQQKYTLVDVGIELQELYKELDNKEAVNHDIGQKIKEWFNSKPDKLILTNASILYHSEFVKISPIGAFKYNSRNKSCVLFLEDEQIISNRLYYGQTGTEEYYDKDINDILITRLSEIKDDFISQVSEREVTYDKDNLPANAIGHLFNYTVIKDVVDIDSDLRELDMKKELISSYIISEGTEQQIIDFFDNLQKPNHKAVKIIGNYGSGKSHLIAFLIGIINNPDLRQFIKNEKVKKATEKITRKFFTVQFELQPVNVDLSYFFFKELEKQIKREYDIDIPKWTPEIIDLKEHITNVILALKKNDATRGLLVIVDEVSDFIQTKVQNEIKRDFQFLRIVAQVCQDQDMLFVTSMQEDIYSSPKLQNIAADEERISQRFQNIVIRKEAVSQVIAHRIVPKSSQQKAELNQKLKPYIEKIEDIANNQEKFIELFPFTPSLLNLFHELPYFEKRGAIQFAQTELKHAIGLPFPYFFTFDRIFDLLENNPNVRNLEDVYDVVKVVNIIQQKITTNLDEKQHSDASKLLKALAVYSLWSKGQNGATSKELAEQLLILPQNKAIESFMQVSMIIKKIREATDGFYIKIVKDEVSGNDYFKFDPHIVGGDPEEKIEKEIVAVSGDTDLQENVLFDQIREILDLEYFKNTPNLFIDECAWISVKSFRKGFIVFQRKDQEINAIDNTDYVINFVSPFSKKKPITYCKNQLNIKIKLESKDHKENIELIKRIVAIKSLISKNVMATAMQKKLQEALEGYRNPAGTTITGIKYRLSRCIYFLSEVELNGNTISVQSTLGKEFNNISEIISELKKKVFDKCFNDVYPEHPKYAEMLTGSNIVNSLSQIADEITSGNSKALTARSKSFISTLSITNTNGDIDISGNKLAQIILTTIYSKNGKVVDIEKEIQPLLTIAPYGLEPETIHFFLIVLTTLGKISLKSKGGGDDFDISNINEKFKSLSQFDNIIYAIKKDDLSYDFACNLMNALGLNGNMILKESTRNEGFTLYLKTVKSINEDLKALSYQVDALIKKDNVFINTKDLQEYFSSITSIEWAKLDIPNHAKFNTLEFLNSKLNIIKDSLSSLATLKQAIDDYNKTIHSGIIYMKDALEIVRANEQYLTEKTIPGKLEQFSKDTILITENFSKFIQLNERFPLSGKIETFKKIYVTEFYYPALQNTIGDKVEWKPLETFTKHKMFPQIMALAQLDCNVPEKINKKIQLWSDLFSWRSKSVDVDRLYQIPFDTATNFMKIVRDYSIIKKESQAVETTLVKIHDDYASTAVTEIKKREQQIEIVKLSTELKKSIKEIIKTGTIPSPLTSQLIDAINKLFVDIKIITLKKEDVLKSLFKKDELITLDQLREAFYNLEQKIKQENKGEEIRLKLE